jgi:hypothetical protein
MNKVYCKDCKYLRIDIGYTTEYGPWEKMLCTHPDNVKTKETWYIQKIKHKKSPKRINKNNDCKWHEERK